jgi:hypothetical protein
MNPNSDSTQRTLSRVSSDPVAFRCNLLSDDPPEPTCARGSARTEVIRVPARPPEQPFPGSANQDRDPKRVARERASGLALLQLHAQRANPLAHGGLLVGACREERPVA